jgi:hypothetical protein
LGVAHPGRLALCTTNNKDPVWRKLCWELGTLLTTRSCRESLTLSDDARIPAGGQSWLLIGCPRAPESRPLVCRSAYRMRYVCNGWRSVSCGRYHYPRTLENGIASVGDGGDICLKPRFDPSYHRMRDSSHPALRSKNNKFGSRLTFMYA